MFNQERYINYYNSLIGKQTAEQFLYKFKNEENQDKYSSILLDNDNYWIANITKHLFKRFFCNPGYLGSLTYSLYMHKFKDFVVLKATIIMPSKCISNAAYINNISTYLTYNLKKHGFIQCEYTNEILPLMFSALSLRNIKVLISKDKTEEDVVSLLYYIDKINNFIFNNPPIVWDNFTSIKENVKIEW